MTDGATAHAGNAAAPGALALALAIDDRRVRAVTVTRGDRPDPADVLGGRPVAQVPGLLAALYAVCGRGQAVTGVRACESALGQAVAPAQAAARRLLVMAEAAREHARRLLLDWPAEVGAEASPAGVRAVAAAAGRIERALYPQGDGMRPGGGRLAPDDGGLAAATAGLREALDTYLGLSAAGCERPDAFRAWWRSEADPAGRTLAALAADAPGFGARDAPAPAALDLGVVTTAPAPAAADPLSRQAAAPPVADALARYGAGVFARVGAQAVELARLPAAMDRLRTDLASDPGAGPPPDGSGEGRAAAGIARGRLTHGCRLAAGTVADYRIAAPTDAAFAPDGPVARALTGVDARDPDALERRARRLVLAFDPCAPWTLRVCGSG